MAIAGTFGDFDLAGVLQMLQGQRAGGRLHLEQDGIRAELMLAKGLVFDASVGGRGINSMCLRYLAAKGLEAPGGWGRHASRTGGVLVARALEQGLLASDEAAALRRMALLDLACELFLWERAHFRFQPEEVQPFGIGIGIDELTLEAMRRSDEASRFSDGLSDETVLERKVALAQFPHREGDVALHHPARHALELVDGVSTVAELAERSWLGGFRLREALYHLRTRDWIEEADSASVHEAILEHEPASRLGWGGAAILAGAALVTLAAALAMRGPVLPSFLGWGDPAARARLDLRERGVRTWDRVQEGRAPVGMAMPDSYGSSP